MADGMQINPQRAKQLAENVASITSRIKAATRDGKPVWRPRNRARTSTPQLIF
jgi:hypothetical protein